MVRIHGTRSRTCDGVTRRSFVEAGALGVGGMMLPELIQLREAQADPQSAARSTQPMAVILFWLSGGPEHMEIWDPKPDAPSEWRGPFGAIETRLAGIRFGELMPEHAHTLVNRTGRPVTLLDGGEAIRELI